MASGPDKATGALWRGCWFWQLNGVRKSSFPPCHVSRGLLNKSGKLKQGSFLGSETSVLEEPVPAQRGIQRVLQEMSFARSSGK